MEWYISNATKPKYDTSDVLLDEVILAYYHGHAVNVRAGTRIKYQLGHITDFFSGMTVFDACKPDVVARFTQKLLKDGLKQSSVNNILSIIKAAVNRAYRLGELTHAPYVGLIKQAQGEPKGRPMTIDEICKLYQHACPHVRAMIVLGLATGARPEAVCELKWGQIDRSSMTIELNQQGRVQTGKYRPTVKLPASLAKWLDEQSKDCDYIVHFRKKPVHRYHEAWKRAKKRAGLTGTVTPYSLRHTVARHLRACGVPAWEVAAQLGHSAGSRLTITERYAAHSPDYLTNACRELDKLLALVLRPTPLEIAA